MSQRENTKSGRDQKDKDKLPAKNTKSGVINTTDGGPEKSGGGARRSRRARGRSGRRSVRRSKRARGRRVSRRR